MKQNYLYLQMEQSYIQELPQIHKNLLELTKKFSKIA